MTKNVFISCNISVRIAKVWKSMILAIIGHIVYSIRKNIGSNAVFWTMLYVPWSLMLACSVITKFYYYVYHNSLSLSL